MSEPNLNDLERRLAGWRPAGEGLDADAMLFAAGRASVQGSAARFAWPVIAAALALALGTSEMIRRTERRDHEAVLAQLTVTPTVPAAAATSEIQAPNYLIVLRSLERDPDALNAAAQPPPEAPADHPMLRAGQRNREVAN